MKIKVVGIESQDYKLDNGYAFKGKKIHCIDLESEKHGLTGNLTTVIKISDDSPLSKVPVDVGCEATVFFNQKGALDYISILN